MPYKIELYGYGCKIDKNIVGMMGVSYITKIKMKNNKNNTSLYKDEVKKGSLMNLMNFRIFKYKTNQIDYVSSMIKMNISNRPIELFKLNMNNIVNAKVKNKFVSFMKKFPTVLIFNMKSEA